MINLLSGIPLSITISIISKSSWKTIIHTHIVEPVSSSPAILLSLVSRPRLIDPSHLLLPTDQSIFFFSSSSLPPSLSSKKEHPRDTSRSILFQKFNRVAETRLLETRSPGHFLYLSNNCGSPKIKHAVPRLEAVVIPSVTSHFISSGDRASSGTRD